MDQLSSEQREKLKLSHDVVEKFQSDPTLCASLSPMDFDVLGELQAIFNQLTSRTISKHQPLFDHTCKGVNDAVKRFTEKYDKVDAQQLYQNYLDLYRTARTRSNVFTSFSEI